MTDSHDRREQLSVPPHGLSRSLLRLTPLSAAGFPQMRKRLLLTTALAGFAAVIAGSNLSAQTAGPGYAATVTGSASTTTTTAFNIVTFNSGWNAAYKIYVTGIECGRTDTSATSIKVAFNDSASTTIVVPGAAGGGMVSIRFDSPLVVAADTALTGTVSAATSTVICSAQGFVAN